MERTISQEERIRRAEEIYNRRRTSTRNGVRVASSSVNNTRTRLSLFKKMGLQLAICAVIYIIFYLIKNTNYIFSEDVIHKTKELLSYDINFGNVYAEVSSFIENNKDKFKIPGIMEEEKNNETLQENQTTNEIKEEENKEEKKIEQEKNEIKQENNEAKVESNNINKGGIGGAEVNEIQNSTPDETTQKTQMEIDAEYVKKQCNFKIPLKGTVTSRYGEREATEVVSANHYGIDIGANKGTAIYAAIEGTVSLVSSEGDYRKTC